MSYLARKTQMVLLGATARALAANPELVDVAVAKPSDSAAAAAAAGVADEESEEDMFHTPETSPRFQPPPI